AGAVRDTGDSDRGHLDPASVVHLARHNDAGPRARLVGGTPGSPSVAGIVKQDDAPDDRREPAGRAVEELKPRGADLAVGTQVEDVVLFEERQDLITPVPPLDWGEGKQVGRVPTAGIVLSAGRGELLDDIVVVVARQRQLLEAVGTLGAIGGLAHL